VLAGRQAARGTLSDATHKGDKNENEKGRRDAGPSVTDG